MLVRSTSSPRDRRDIQSITASTTLMGLVVEKKISNTSAATDGNELVSPTQTYLTYNVLATMENESTVSVYCGLLS